MGRGWANVTKTSVIKPKGRQRKRDRDRERCMLINVNRILVIVLFMFFFFVIPGWHRRINKKSNGCSLGFYTLVPILQQEAAFVQICLQLLNENQYRRDERRKYSRIQRQLDEIWECYAEGSLSTVELLTKTSKLYGEFFKDREKERER